MLGAVLVTAAHEAGLGLSSFLALGNRADVSGNDLLQYWEADDTTDVVGMYIESFGNPRQLQPPGPAAHPRQAGGRGEGAAGSSTPMARSGDATEDALLRQTGVLRVPTLDAARRHRPAAARPSRCPPGAGSRCSATPVGRSPSPPTRCSPRTSSWPTWRPATLAEVAAPPTPDAVAGHRRPRSPRRCPRRGAGHGRARRRPRGRRAARPLRRGPRGHRRRGGRRGRRRAQGPPRGAGGRVRLRAAPHPVGRGARVRRDRRRGRRARPRGGLRRVAAPSPRARSLALDDEQAAAARQLVQEHLDARARPSSATSRRWPCSTPSGCRCCAPRWPPTSTRRQAAAASMGYPVVLKAAGRAPTAKTAAAGFAIDLEGPDALRARVGADGRRAR